MIGDGIQEAVLVRDDESYGIYPMPVSLVVVDRLPGDTSDVPRSWAHTATLSGETCTVDPGATAGTRDVRVVSATTGTVRAWVTCSHRSAFAWLLDALPNFWLNRHRLTSAVSEALRRNTPLAIDASPKRTRFRERLIHHANSLKCKLWTLQYHRGNLRAAIEDCRQKPHEKNLHLIRANAEFTAHDNECYALLDELARVLSLMTTIRTGGETPHPSMTSTRRVRNVIRASAPSLSRSTGTNHFECDARTRRTRTRHIRARTQRRTRCSFGSTRIDKSSPPQV